MAGKRSAWNLGAEKIDRLMRKDVVEIYESRPIKNEIGEISDNPVLIGTYNANVTTPTEGIGEEFEGNVRPHFYQITLAPTVVLPRESKIFVKLIKVRQGDVGAMVEVTDISGGLLGQTLNAADEKN